MRVPLLLVLGLLGLLSGPTGADMMWQWHEGRATHYNGPGDWWSIHEGFCGYGYLDPTVATGWHITAPSDQLWGWGGSGSCGKCYEVSCQNKNFADGYGMALERTGVCYDEGASVIVMVTDVCPCNYPNNDYSNKRWCCGDMQHHDLSIWAFEKLADPKWGVIGIKWREVPCDHKPDRPAQLPSGRSPSPSNTPPPWGFTPSKDKRITGDVYWNTEGLLAPTGSSNDIYHGGFNDGWSATASYKRTAWGRDDSWGPDSRQALCGTLEPFGATVLTGPQGAFNGKSNFDFWVKQNDRGTPKMWLTLQAADGKGSCKTVTLSSGVRAVEQRSDWLRFQINLQAFNWFNTGAITGGGNGGAFSGCGGAVGGWDANEVVFKNADAGSQALCLYDVKAY